MGHCRAERNSPLASAWPLHYLHACAASDLPQDLITSPSPSAGCAAGPAWQAQCLRARCLIGPLRGSLYFQHRNLGLLQAPEIHYGVTH